MVSKSSLPPSRAQPPDSPSFAMLLNRQSNCVDVPEMPTLLDLSMADMGDVTITAHSDTPGPVPKRQLSQTLREAAPSPGSVAQLIGRFSKSPSDTPDKATPKGASTSPLSGTESASSRPTSKTSPLSAEATGSSSTPSTSSQRRISPLPRRANTYDPCPDDEYEDSPNRSLKRKGSDIELSFVHSTPVPRPKAAPRFSQPLIAFGDTPTRRQSLHPFVFGAGHAGFFDDLMGIQTGEGDEDDVVHEGITQLIDGLTVSGVDEPAGVDVDLMGSPVPPTLPPALRPESTGETADLLDFGDNEPAESAVAESTAESTKESENDETVMEVQPAETESADVTVIAVATEESASETDEADDTVLAAPPPATDEHTEESSASEAEDADTTVLAAAATADEAAPTSPGPAPTSELSFDLAALTQSMAAATLSTPASKGVLPQPPSAFKLVSPWPKPAAAATPTTSASAVKQPSPAKVEATPVRTAPEAPSVAPTPTAKAPQAEEQAEQPSEEPSPQTTEETSEEPNVQPAEEAQPELNAEAPVAEAHEESAPTEAAPTAAPAAAVQPAQLPAAAPRTRGHMRSTTAPVKPTSASARLGPPSRPTRPTPGEKKPFKPVSKLGMSDSGKSAPAPARLAMATKASQAKTAAAPAPARKAAPAPAQKPPSAPTSKPPSRGPSRPASRAMSRTASPLPGQEAATLTQSTASNASAATKPKLPAKAVSNLLKPTAAAAARAAATVVPVKEKEPVKEAKLSRPPTAAANRVPSARVVSSSRPANSLLAPTAASRARAEPALPPSKRQRIKLKAPMESFKPGRGRANPSKAAILGQAAPRPRREMRTAKRAEKAEKVETFPLPGPELVSSTSEAPVEAPPAAERAPSLNIPAPQDEAEGGMARTPTSLSPLAHSAALSPASSRHTDRSFDSSKSSPRKMRPSPSRPLDPVLTPLHHTLSETATPTRPGRDTPATAHARRISGIPASIQRSMSASRERAEQQAVEEDEEVEEKGEGVTSVVRHDVSTPQGKASSLLAKFGAERRALTPRDGNKD